METELLFQFKFELKSASFRNLSVYRKEGYSLRDIGKKLKISI